MQRTYYTLNYGKVTLWDCLDSENEGYVEVINENWDVISVIHNYSVSELEELCLFEIEDLIKENKLRKKSYKH